MRGYAAIGLVNPKNGLNVGGVMRAASVYGAAMVSVAGPRYKRFKRFPTDTMKAWKHMPVMEVDCVFDALPHDCVPVAVEIIEGAADLPTFRHPERALYIFGAEDATLGKSITDRCTHVVSIPTSRCMNLAATANVVLYDRLAKQMAHDIWPRIAALEYRLTQQQKTVDKQRAQIVALQRGAVQRKTAS